ncbi:common central domain of tyrosinase-domain-containing protein [Chiua virens]|nr:common central domain of tyrosinase-domain-containing protein [Chiua virens]
MTETQPYPVIGIDDTGIQPRLDLRDLQEKPIQFSLFIRALRKILDMTSTDVQDPDYMNKPNSWWQIGAIHGLPYMPWSGDPNGPQTPDPNSPWQGYCYHGSALFPTWHRALMLLVEQAVVREAIKIASDLEAQDPAARKEQWLQVAKELRFPFWDWTKAETADEGIPRIFQEAETKIVNPGGSSVPVQNPLNHYRYAADPGVAQGAGYMGQWKRTYRWVDNGDNPQKEMYDQAAKAFSQGMDLELEGSTIPLKPVHWLRGKVAGLFQYPLTLQDPSYGPNMWGYFSNTNATEDQIYVPVQIALPSIEESHNMVHLDTGGNGTMSLNEYAAFDPIFYLHHCNVDRIYAFWEYVYPAYWIEDGWKNEQGEIVPFHIDANGNFQQDPSTSIGHTYPLVPFRMGDSNYWTSDNTRSLWVTNPTKKFYTYPAIKDPTTGVEVKVDVPYDTADNTVREKFRQALLMEWGSELHSALQTVKNLSVNLHPQHRNLLLNEDQGVQRLRHFVVLGKLPEFAFSGSYRLELFLRPKQSQQTSTSQSTVQVVNSISVLGRANPDNCTACKDRRAAGSHIRGYMPLDPRLILHLLSRLDLTQLPMVTNLDWLTVLIKESFGTRLVKPDGTVLAAADPSVPAQPNETLEEAKAPELTLHSHYINFEYADSESADSESATPTVTFGTPVHHGSLGDKSGWKVF